MKKKMIVLLTGSFFLMRTQAQNVETIDLTTGWDNSNSSYLNPTDIDETWSVLPPGYSTYYDAIVSNGDLVNDTQDETWTATWDDPACGSWISPYTLTSGTYEGYVPPLSNNNVSGDYLYTTTFKLDDDCPLDSVVINISRIGGDNEVTKMVFNGYDYTFSPTFGFSSPLGGSLSITINSVHLNPGGINTLSFNVNNSSTFTGFFFCGDVTIYYGADPMLTSSFTAPTAVCFGSPINLDGSASGGIATQHHWTVVECNASGVPVTGASTWVSSVFMGNPGAYTLPSAGSGGPNLQCDKYYLVQLFVENECTKGFSSSEIVRVNCLPSVCDSPNITICSGQCATIGCGGRTPAGYTFEWTTLVGGLPVTVGSTKQITVCPINTTTYTLTVTNSSTGCTNTDQVIVTVDHDCMPNGMVLHQESGRHNGGILKINGIDENQDVAETKIYPNPSSGLFTLEVAGTNGKIRVFDAVGKNIRTIELNGRSHYTLDLTGYAKGIYTVNVVSGNTSQSEKIILE